MTDDLIQQLRDATDKVELLVLKTEAANALQDLRALVATVQREKEDLRAEIERLKAENQRLIKQSWEYDPPEGICP